MLDPGQVRLFTWKKLSEIEKGGKMVNLVAAEAAADVLDKDPQ